MKRIMIITIAMLVNITTVTYAAYFSIKPDKIIFTHQGKKIKIIPLKPKIPVGDKGEYIVDKVLNNLHYLLIYRDYHYLGDFCHRPDVRKIEVYNKVGDNLFNITESPRLYVGKIPIFSRHWMIIADPQEGAFSGFALINMKKKYNNYITINTKGSVFIHAFKYNSGFSGDKDVMWIILKNSRDVHETIIEIDENGHWKQSAVQFKNPI